VAGELGFPARLDSITNSLIYRLFSWQTMDLRGHLGPHWWTTQLPGFECRSGRIPTSQARNSTSVRRGISASALGKEGARRCFLELARAGMPIAQSFSKNGDRGRCIAFTLKMAKTEPNSSGCQQPRS
jgi:hypothetical protein